MDIRLQIVAIVGAVGLLLFVLELVRRRALMERYALLWLLRSVVILGLAVCDDALTVLARQLGIVSAPNALFFVALGVHPPAAAALLGGDVAAQRPVEGARPAPGDPRAAAARARAQRRARQAIRDPMETLLRSSGHRGS